MPCVNTKEICDEFFEKNIEILHFLKKRYNLFAALWTAAFISATGDLVLAGAVSAWYIANLCFKYHCHLKVVIFGMKVLDVQQV